MADPANTPFSEAVKVTAVPGSATSFTTNIPRDWSGSPSAHGGYLQSLIYSTARTYQHIQYPSKAQPDPIASHVQFLKPVEIGPVKLNVNPVSIGSRVSVLQIEVQMTDPDSGNVKVCVISTITLGNLATETGLNLPTAYTLRREDIPDREKDCQEYFWNADWKDIAPGVLKLRQLRVTSHGLKKLSATHSKSIRGTWYAFKDGTGFDVLSLGCLIDMFGGAPTEYASKKDEDYFSGIFYPTLSISTEIKRDPKNCKWLFLKVQAQEVRNGRFDENVTVLNEEGELIALCKHVSLVSSRKSPEDMKRIYNL